MICTVIFPRSTQDNTLARNSRPPVITPHQYYPRKSNVAAGKYYTPAQTHFTSAQTHFTATGKHFLPP